MLTVIIGILLALFASVVPAILWSLFVWWCDRYEREPLGLVIITFWWGAVPAVIFSILVEGVLSIPLRPLHLNSVLLDVVESSAVAPIVEEALKGLALLALFLMLRHEFDGVLDGVIYGALIGFGFAMSENLLYFLGALMEGGLGNLTVVIFLRAILFGLNHAFFTAITGVGLGLARLSRNAAARWLLPLAGLAAAMTFHAIHNLGTSLAQVNFLTFFVSIASDWAGVVVVAAIVFMAWHQEKGWIVAELADEVGITLTREEYVVAASYGRRLRQWFAGARGRQLGRLHHLATELAFKKHRLRALGAAREPKLAEEIVWLRGHIRELRVRLGMPPLTVA